MFLIAYDGSPSARAAIDAAGRLFPGQQAVVLTTWEPLIDTLARSGAIGLGGGGSGPNPELEAQVAEHALTTATVGADLASAAGLSAVPRTEPSAGSPAATILHVADAIDADAIVLGSRGHGRVASLLLGSTSHNVLHHATHPVVVVPSPADGSDDAATASAAAAPAAA